MAVYALSGFYNENDIAEIKMATLDPVVDYFVFVEANQTHSGKEKPLYFDHERFKPWRKKIRYMAIDLEGENDWQREKEQRRRLWDGFDGEQNDLILLSDLDEIPHPDAVRRGNTKQPYILLCRMHVAKLNYRWKAEAHESHSICRILPAGMIMSGQLANLEEARLTHMAPVGPPGWHLSWMQGIGQKLGAFVHQEMVPYARPEFALAGGPLFPGLIDQAIEKCDLSELPPYVTEQKERFAHLLV